MLISRPPAATHQCTLFTILGRTRVQRVTMPCRLTSFDRNCRGRHGRRTLSGGE